MEQFESTLISIPIERIVISKRNPRKTVDQVKLGELMMSVKKYGVLQSVLLRPYKGAYELVCGERRYLAALNVGLIELPANIRDMSDDEAFEMQIIENLQRNDIHPLEEAEAFLQMIDSTRYTYADIAGKIGKNEDYVVKRLKLNEIIPEIKQDFLHHELGIGHAILIARLSKENQLGIYKFYKDRLHGYGTQAQLQQEIQNKTLDLKTATFPLDKDFAHAKACNGCMHRSSTNPLLFSDLEGSDICFLKVCYNSKTSAHIESEAEQAIETDGDIILGTAYGPALKEVAGAAGKAGVPILQAGTDFSIKEIPDGEKKKLLYVGGNDMGMYADVWVPKSTTAATKQENTIAEQIRDIENKAKRSLAIDEEKIHEAIIAELKAEIKKNTGKGFNLNKDYIDAMTLFFVIEHYGWFYAYEIFDKIGVKVEINSGDLDLVVEQLRAITPEQKKMFLVHVMLKNCSGSTDDRGTYGKIIRKLADNNTRIPVDAITAAQAFKANERIKRTEEKLQALRAKESVPKKDKQIKAVK